MEAPLTPLYYIGQDATRAVLVNDLFPDEVFFEFIPFSHLQEHSISASATPPNAICLVDLLEEPGQLQALCKKFARHFEAAHMIALHLYRHEAQIERLSDLGFHQQVQFTQVASQLPGLVAPLLKADPAWSAA